MNACAEYRPKIGDRVRIGRSPRVWTVVCVCWGGDGVDLFRKETALRRREFTDRLVLVGRG